MSVDFQNEDVELPSLEYGILKRWLIEVIQIHQKQAGNILVNFCSDNYILEVNRQFLKHDYFTDIITFNYSSSKKISGDLLISLDTVQTNSALFKTSFQRELLRVIVHGVLHLLGFDDKTPEEQIIMRSKEDYCLNLLDNYQHINISH